MANRLVTDIIERTAYLCNLNTDQAAVLHAAANNLKTAQDAQALVQGLLGARSFRLLLWGPPGSGKTFALRRLAEALVDRGGKSLYYLDADRDSTPSRGFSPQIVQVPPMLTIGSEEQCIAHIRTHVEMLIQQIGRGIDAARGGSHSGYVMDSITSWAEVPWNTKTLLEMSETFRKKDKMQQQRTAGAVASLIKSATISLYHATDGNLLKETPQAPGPFVIATIAHAKSENSGYGTPHEKWVLSLGERTAEALLAKVDYSLGFGLDTAPKQKRSGYSFKYDQTTVPDVKARLDTQEARDLAEKCAKTADVAGLVTGLYEMRVRDAIAHIAEQNPA